MAGFTYHRRSGRVIATFGVLEGDVLRSLASQLVGLLGDDQAVAETEEDPFAAMVRFNTQEIAEPDDPVLMRLLPNAYPDDDESAAEFRRFTESSLREQKSTGAGRLIASLTEAGLPDQVAESDVVLDVELDADEAMVWLRTLNDMRLALGTRLGVAEGDEERWDALAEDDPTAQTHHIYDWLGFLQETLVRAMGKL